MRWVMLFPEVHDHLNCYVDVECEVIFLTPHSEGPHLLPVGRLVIVGNQAYHCSVVWKRDDWVGGVRGHAVVGEKGVQEGAENAPLWGPRSVYAVFPTPKGQWSPYWWSAQTDLGLSFCSSETCYIGWCPSLCVDRGRCLSPERKASSLPVP